MQFFLIFPISKLYLIINIPDELNKIRVFKLLSLISKVYKALIYILATFAKNKWKNLCDSYKKCLDQECDNTRTGSGATKPPLCRYYNQLSFLCDTVRNRKTQSNVTLLFVNRNNIASTPTSSTSSDADLSLSDSTSIQDPKDSDESPKDSEPLATIVPNKKKKSQEIDPIDKYLISAINDKKCEKAKEDSNDLFC